MKTTINSYGQYKLTGTGISPIREEVRLYPGMPFMLLAGHTFEVKNSKMIGTGKKQVPSEIFAHVGNRLDGIESVCFLETYSPEHGELWFYSLCFEKGMEIPKLLEGIKNWYFDPISQEKYEEIKNDSFQVDFAKIPFTLEKDVLYRFKNARTPSIMKLKKSEQLSAHQFVERMNEKSKEAANGNPLAYFGFIDICRSWEETEVFLISDHAEGASREPGKPSENFCVQILSPNHGIFYVIFEKLKLNDVFVKAS